MSHPDDDSLMLAYVYGELSDEEARAFEERLAADAGLRAEVDGLLATRDLLKQDARYGEVSGADLPPPHLAEAILRAEALARPLEVRQARTRSGYRGFLARVQIWLVGGGLAVGAAAGLLVLSRGAVEAPDAAAEAPAAVPQESAPAAAEKAAARDDHEEQRRAAPRARAPAKGAVSTGANGQEPPPAEPLADSDDRSPLAAKPIGGARSLSLDREVARRPARNAERSQAPSDPSDSKPRARAELDALGAGDADAYADGLLQEPSPEAKKARPASSSRSEPAVTAGWEAEAEPAPAAARDDDVRETRGAETRQRPFSAESTPAPSGGGAAAPAAEPVAQSVPPGPPPLPEAARRELEAQRAKRRPAAKGERARARAPANQTLADELQLSLLTAERELQEGRPLEALDLFSSVARRDPRGALTGVVPYVGQMRALAALSRHQEVLALLPTVKRPGLRATGVPEGILVAARSAEALGQLELARSLYRELLSVREQRKEAAAALERLDARHVEGSTAATADEPPEATSTRE